ncbi:MAG: HAMP domain-containing histidine kinase, partial [Eubacterium sp.]|nr:HAMP domain-containing histidine kinase [Eubacterium sp.]
ADISHQLKTPITSITMMSDLLKNEEDEDKRKEFSEVIENQLSRMNWLIVTLLKLSKIDAGAIEFKNSDVKLKTILKKSAQPFLLNAEINNIDLSVECADNISVFVDSNWYIEAVSNIIKNCIEHTENGGYVKVYAEETAVFTKIHIKDNGSGIAKEDIPHVFERFYQGKNHNESSVGIGLALSKAILNKQNSMIEVRSEENIGTEFEITIHKVIV